MTEELWFDPALSRTRWVACIDLLGTRERLVRGEDERVFDAYSEAIEKLERDGRNIEGISHLWFSDGFWLVTADDSGPAFTRIELLTRSFSYFLLVHRVPFRAAIACGDMYADFENGVYLGLGMIEAYEYGDGQDWVGLVLCPTAVEQLKRFEISMDSRLNWQPFAVPWSRRPKGCPDEVPACILGQSFQINGRNVCLEALREMAVSRSLETESVRQKYMRTIDFIARNQRVVSRNG